MYPAPWRHHGTHCRGISSIGRVRALQARGTGIETLMLHCFFFFACHRLTTRNFVETATIQNSNDKHHTALPEPRTTHPPTKDTGLSHLKQLLGWPSGPRRLTQVQVSSDAWVRIPLQAFLVGNLVGAGQTACKGDKKQKLDNIKCVSAGKIIARAGHWSSGMILL